MNTCPTCGHPPLRIITLPTGKIKPDLQGTARFTEVKTYFIGPEYTRTQIPEYEIVIDGSKGIFKGCQAGRDFNFD